MLNPSSRVSLRARVMACFGVLTLTAACGSAARTTEASTGSSSDGANYGSFGSDPCQLRSPMRISIDGRVVADGKHLAENAQVSARRGDTISVDLALVDEKVNLNELHVYVTQDAEGLSFPLPPETVNSRSDGSSVNSGRSRSARVPLEDRRGRPLDPGSYRLVMEAIVAGDSEACTGTQASQAVVYPLSVRPMA
jgi:hypothetical protein